MSEEIEIWSSEYELRQFIDMATRWGIEGIFKSRTKENPYSVFDYYVKNAKDKYDMFCSQLNKKLTANQNWKAIEIDIRDRFLPMIEQYLNWYEQNKLELKKFQPYCPYEIMVSVIESTKKEILKYFPDTLPSMQTEIQNPIRISLGITKDKLKLISKIEELTEDKLVSYGFSKDLINNVLKRINYPDCKCSNDKGYFIASQKERLIYSGTEALRKEYFIDNERPNFPFLDNSLFQEFVDLSFAHFTNEYQIKHGFHISETQIKQICLNKMIDKFKIDIDNLKNVPKGLNQPQFKLAQIDTLENALLRLETINRNQIIENSAISAKIILDQLPQIDMPNPRKLELNSLSKIEITNILLDIKNSENKFWKGLPMEQVINHFEVLTSRKNKNGNFYLTPEQLIFFLKKGFLNDTIQPFQKINCSNGEKGFVIKRFYEFFDLAVSKYGYPQRKEKFILLFTNCFDNWEPSTIETFFKPNKTKQNW